MAALFPVTSPAPIPRSVEKAARKKKSSPQHSLASLTEDSKRTFTPTTTSCSAASQATRQASTDPTHTPRAQITAERFSEIKTPAQAADDSHTSTMRQVSPPMPVKTLVFASPIPKPKGVSSRKSGAATNEGVKDNKSTTPKVRHSFLPLLSFLARR